MEDQAIVNLYWAREEQALAETDKKYGPYCQSIAWNILRSRPEAERKQFSKNPWRTFAELAVCVMVLAGLSLAAVSLVTSPPSWMAGPPALSSVQEVILLRPGNGRWSASWPAACLWLFRCCIFGWHL